VTHKRLVLRAGDRGWLVRDRVSGSAVGPIVEARWQLAPGLRADATDAAEADGGAALDVCDAAGAPVARLVAVGNGSWRHEAGWVSPQYGARESAERLVWTLAAGAEDREVVLLVLPPDAGGRLPSVRGLAAEGDGRALLISAPGGADTADGDVVLLGRGAAQVGAGAVAADAECAWSAAAAGVAVAVGGGFLALPGAAILPVSAPQASTSDAARYWQVAERAHDAWHLRGGSADRPPDSNDR
jgi:hypothetical protein